MGEDTLWVIPYKLHVGPRLGGTATGPRARVLQTVWEGKAGALRAVPPGTRRQEVRGAPLRPGVYLGQSGAQHCLQKGQRPLMPPLRQGFRRHGALRTHLRGFRGPWGQGSLGVTSVPTGDEGQKEFAGHF